MPEIHASKVYATAIDQVTALIKARVPIIWVVTYEENRFIEDLATSDKVKNRKTWYWSATSGIINNDERKIAANCSGQMENTQLAMKALDKIHDIKRQGNEGGLVFVMRDFHIGLQDQIARKLRDIYETLADNRKTIIIVTPFLAYVGGSGIHPLLEKQVVVVDFNLPVQAQIEKRVKHILDTAKNDIEASGQKLTVKLEYTDEEHQLIAGALRGLTFNEIENAVATSLAHLKLLDPEVLIQEKKQIIRKNQLLEFIDTEVGQDEVGGLDLVKEYLVRYQRAFSKEAKDFGIEPLRGIILTGIPGVGKSLLCKTIGHLWKVPLLRLDIGKVMGKLVGQSEEQMRAALNTASSCAPCLLWCDEIEKSLSGSKSSNSSDGGTFARVFGTLLTAMQEGLEGVTVVATSNDISSLPPELIRRFNEVFFVDLPSQEERWEIFGIHLAKRKRNIKNFETAKKQILEASEGYTGAEIEKAIKDAIATAFYAGEKDINACHLLAALQDTKPICKVYSEKILEMQKWAQDHARYASSFSKKKMQNIKDKTTIKDLELDKLSGDLDKIKTPGEKVSDAVAEGNDRFKGLAD